MREGTRAFLASVAEHPEFAQTLLIESIGAGPDVARRRDEIVHADWANRRTCWSSPR